METLRILVSILGAISYIGTIALVIYLYLALRDVRAKQEYHLRTSAKIYALTSAIKLQYSFDQINEMKIILKKLIKEENYEEANKLNDVIAKSLQEALAALEIFKKTFGEEVDTTIVTLPTK